MKILRLLSVSVFFFMLLFSCGQSQIGQSKNLTENLAMKLIREKYNYPELLTITISDVRPDSPLGREISRLINEGYLLPQESYFEGFKISEKGKNIIRSCVWNNTYQMYDIFSPFTHQRDVVRIKKILTDSKSGTATVTYELGYTPTPYFDKLRGLDKEKVDFEVRNREMRPLEITDNFKKYDQGWQIIP
jgi:hypothetical protein